MNIFITSECPVESAYNLCHVHVVKMITESCQMLSTAHHVIDQGFAPKNIYKLTHVNHPSNIWCRSSVDNYKWLLRHTEALGEVYTLRTGKVHGALEKCLKSLSEPPKNIFKKDLTELPRAMDDDLKASIVDTSEAYQKYLNRKYKEWLTREKPMKVEFTVAIPHWLDYDVRKLIEGDKS